MIPENERARREIAPLYKTNAHEVPRQRSGEQDETRLEGVMPTRQLNAVHSAPPTTGPMNMT